MADLKRAIKSYGRAKESEKAATRRHIVSEAKRLKHPELIPSNWAEAPKKVVKVSATVAALRARVHGGGLTAAYVEWMHPRGLHGKWIEKGGLVNIHMPGGKKRRAQISDLTEKGPEVTFKDDNSKEVISLKDAAKRIEVPEESVARLDAPNAPNAPEAPSVPYVPQRDENGKLIVSPESAAMGKEIYDRAVAGEPALTAKLAALVEDSDPENYKTPESGGGGELYGYKYRLKAEAGISEKIERYIADEGLSREDAAGEIKDANRYTIHYPEDALGPNAQRILDEIAADPNTLKMNVKNTWPPEMNRAYKGINVNVWTKDGMVYEIQFHTPNSQAVKDKMHALYEDQRTKTVAGSPEWQKYEDEMKGMAATLPMPTGAAEVKTPKVGPKAPGGGGEPKALKDLPDLSLGDQISNDGGKSWVSVTNKTPDGNMLAYTDANGKRGSVAVDGGQKWTVKKADSPPAGLQELKSVQRGATIKDDAGNVYQVADVTPEGLKLKTSRGTEILRRFNPPAPPAGSTLRPESDIKYTVVKPAVASATVAALRARVHGPR